MVPMMLVSQRHFALSVSSALSGPGLSEPAPCHHPVVTVNERVEVDG